MSTTPEPHTQEVTTQVSRIALEHLGAWAQLVHHLAHSGAAHPSWCHAAGYHTGRVGALRAAVVEARWSVAGPGVWRARADALASDLAGADAHRTDTWVMRGKVDGWIEAAEVVEGRVISRQVLDALGPAASAIVSSLSPDEPVKLAPISRVANRLRLVGREDLALALPPPRTTTRRAAPTPGAPGAGGSVLARAS